MNPRHQAFADEYLANGNNATKAYLKVSPNVTIATAEVEGHKYLKKPKIKEYLDEKLNKASQNAQITLQEVLTRLVRIASTNEGNDDRTSILALQEINKILGHYSPTKTDNKTDITSNGNEIKTIIVE